MVANSSDLPLQARIAALEQENDRLRKSEARYRQVVENSPISILFINTEGYLTEMNAAAEDLFGLSIDELNQQASPIFDNPQLVENGTLPYMLRAFAGEAVIEAPTTYDASRDAAGGKLNYGRGHYAPIRNADGSVAEIVEIGADFNDFFALQAQLLEEKDRAAQERSQLLGAIAQVANLLLRSSDYNTVLPDVVQLLGEAVGSDRCGVAQDIVEPDSGRPAAEIIALWQKLETINQYDVTPETASPIPWEVLPTLHQGLLQQEVINGLVADFEESSRRLFVAQGVSSVLCVPIVVQGRSWGQIGFDNCGEPRLYDEAEIAILKIAADSLAAAIGRQVKDDELRRSEALYRSLFEISNEGIYRFELDPPIPTSLSTEEQLGLAYNRYKLVQVNQTFVEMYGSTLPNGILGRGLVNIYPKDSKQNLEFNYDFINNGYRIRSRESEGVTFNGEQRYFLNGVIGFVEGDRVTGGWGTQIDITEQRLAQQALLQASQDRAELLKTVTTVANQLLRSTDYMTVLPNVLQILGEAASADRCGLIQNITDSDTGKPAVRMHTEWCRIGIQSSISHTPDLNSALLWELFPDGYTTLSEGKTLCVLANDLVEPARSILLAQGNVSMLFVPIIVQDQFWGVFGFDYCQTEKTHDEATQTIFAIAVDSIAAAIERQAKDDELRQSEALYRSLFEISNEGIYRWQLDQPISLSLSVEEQVKQFYQNYSVAQANGSFAEMYGLATGDDVVGIRLTDHHIADSEKNHVFTTTLVESGYRIRNAESEEIDVTGQKRFFLNSGFGFIQNDRVTGGWGTQIDITNLRESQQALLQVEQRRAAELAKANEELQQREHEVQRSYRLLSTVAAVSKDLLENAEVDSTIAQALKQIGEAAGISRVGLMQERTEVNTGRMQHHVLLEWTAPGMPPQINDPATKVIQNDEYGRLVDDLHIGRSTWNLLEELPTKLAQEQQAGIAVKSTGAVPIFIEGHYYGCVFFDDCIEYRQWSAQEIDVLAAGAGAIGAALHRKQLVDRLIAERLYAAQERAAELAKANEALKRSLTLLAHEPSLDNFLGYVLQTIADQFGDRSGAVYLYSEVHNTTLLHLNYENGHLQQGDLITHPAATLPRPPKAWDDQYLPLLRQNQLLVHHTAEFDSPAYAPYRQHNRDRGIQTLLIVPMLFDDQLLGSLTLRSTQHRNYIPEELELARALAQQATLAIQLTQLAEQRRQTAVLEERNRMARDIHDTLAQSFTGIIMQLEATKSLPNSNCPDLHTSLDCIGELARLGLSEARRSVRALRLEALETADFATALQRLLRRTTNGTSIRASLTIEGTPKPLSPHLEENLLRIAQEALTNAIRHGHAHTITLQLLFEPTTVHLQITDDGSGFDPHSTSLSGFGLLGMQERTDQLNGQFHLVSQPEQGTAITVSVPI